MPGTIGGDPQKMLDVAVQFSNKAEDIFTIMTDLGNVVSNNIQPSLSGRVLGSFQFLWAAWYDEMLGISKADEAMGLALGNAAQGLLAVDGQPTDAELKDLATLKEQYSQFKSTFSSGTSTATNTANTAKNLDPNNPNASTTNSSSPTSPPPPPASPPPPPASPPPPPPPPASPPPPPPPPPRDGIVDEKPTDQPIGLMTGDNAPQIYQDSKGNLYVKNPNPTLVAPGTPIRKYVDRPAAPSDYPFNPTKTLGNITLVGHDSSGRPVYQDHMNRWWYSDNTAYYPLPQGDLVTAGATA